MKNELLKELSNYDVTVTDGYPLYVTGSDEELKRIEKDLLIPKNFVNDTKFVSGKIPEKYGSLMIVAEQVDEFGYLIMPAEEKEEDHEKILADTLDDLGAAVLKIISVAA